MVLGCYGECDCGFIMHSVEFRDDDLLGDSTNSVSIPNSKNRVIYGIPIFQFSF